MHLIKENITITITTIIINEQKENILIVDDDVNTSLKYKKWLEEEEEGFNLTLINDPNVAEQIFKPEKYDLVLIVLECP